MMEEFKFSSEEIFQQEIKNSLEDFLLLCSVGNTNGSHTLEFLQSATQISIMKSWSMMNNGVTNQQQKNRREGFAKSDTSFITRASYVLEQWFSNGGTCTPEGTWKHCRGYVRFSLIHLKKSIYAKILEQNVGAKTQNCKFTATVTICNLDMFVCFILRKNSLMQFNLIQCWPALKSPSTQNCFFSSCLGKNIKSWREKRRNYKHFKMIIIY